eukprot:CAMPEP_0171324460 /NCGR_PEP_ID=MMETSP0816-20121228/116199_1 /TAXON_ID=420281 /ORGANISM="Proboscia inermis, Strain CCAP1064/1" /LENGTH=338 /DNA_ID=CAMNT_0011823391 /DNA_START=310 /DNA_END=1326 /DNA_ORIENTATION=-
MAALGARDDCEIEEGSGIAGIADDNNVVEKQNLPPTQKKIFVGTPESISAHKTEVKSADVLLRKLERLEGEIEKLKGNKKQRQQQMFEYQLSRQNQSNISNRRDDKYLMEYIKEQKGEQNKDVDISEDENYILGKFALMMEQRMKNVRTNADDFIQQMLEKLDEQLFAGLRNIFFQDGEKGNENIDAETNSLKGRSQQSRNEHESTNTEGVLLSSQNFQQNKTNMVKAAKVRASEKNYNFIVDKDNVNEKIQLSDKIENSSFERHQTQKLPDASISLGKERIWDIRKTVSAPVLYVWKKISNKMKYPPKANQGRDDEKLSQEVDWAKNKDAKSYDSST